MRYSAVVTGLPQVLRAVEVLGVLKIPENEVAAIAAAFAGHYHP